MLDKKAEEKSKKKSVGIQLLGKAKDELVAIRNLLQNFEIPINSWGIGKSRPVSKLLKELLEKDSYLKIDSTGITRKLQIVKMHIIDSRFPERGNLIETHQRLKNGQFRERNQMPSGKIKVDETPETAFIREIWEELKQKPEDYTYKVGKVTTEFRSSSSFPGLPTVYDVNHIYVSLKPNSSALREEFEIEEDDGTIAHFKWIRNPPIG